MINDLLLPVGSCVRISNCPKMIMIAGHLPYDDVKDTVYDYIGIYYPIGIRKPKKDIELDKDYIYFNNSDIEKIVYLGFSEDKSDFYRKCLLDIKNKLKDTNGLSKEKFEKIMTEVLQGIKERDKNE